MKKTRNLAQQQKLAFSMTANNFNVFFPRPKVVVCAHRYVSKDDKGGDARYGQGLCYVLDNELNFDDVYEPCKGRSIEREHEDYAYCQAGTSSTILEDGTLMLGTPGKPLHTHTYPIANDRHLTDKISMNFLLFRIE